MSETGDTRPDLTYLATGALPFNRDALEAMKLQAEIRKLHSERRQIEIEMRKLRRETFFYPVVVGTGMALAVVGFLGLFY